MTFDPRPVRADRCGSCIFRTDGRAVELRPGRLAEIRAYLARGITHDCHSAKRAACRGGRDFQLRLWHQLGILPEPTDAALAAEMARMGIEPAKVLKGANDGL